MMLFFFTILILLSFLLLGFLLFVSALEKNEKVFHICVFIMSVIFVGLFVYGCL